MPLAMKDNENFPLPEQTSENWEIFNRRMNILFACMTLDFWRSQQPVSLSSVHWYSPNRDIFVQITQLIEGANENRSLALEGVGKERPVRGQPAHREDIKKARRDLTSATTLYPNRITVYIH